MRKTNEKGITLVALIVTIIILLILAGVTIAQLTESGLFEKAKLADQKSENAQLKEEETLGDYENKISEIVGTSDTNNTNTWKKLIDEEPSLDEITSTEDIFNELLKDEADIEYMLNDKNEVMNAVVNSKVAMKLIGNNENVCKRIFGDITENINVNTTWVSAILNSSEAISALDETNPITVPIMTGYGEDEDGNPKVQASSEYNTSYQAWQVFNGTTSGNTDSWCSIGTPAWIQYKFDEPVLIYKFYMQNRSYSYPLYVNAPYEFSLQGSLDGESWDILGEYSNQYYTSTADDYYVVQNINKKYYYYRINVSSMRTSDGNILSGGDTAIGRLQFYGQ